MKLSETFFRITREFRKNPLKIPTCLPVPVAIDLFCGAEPRISCLYNSYDNLILLCPADVLFELTLRYRFNNVWIAIQVQIPQKQISIPPTTSAHLS